MRMKEASMASVLRTRNALEMEIHRYFQVITGGNYKVSFFNTYSAVERGIQGVPLVPGP